MKRFSLKGIMLDAWKFVKKQGITMSEALKKAWSKAKLVAATLEKIGEEAHTWYGWKMLGFEVIHNEKTIAQVTVPATTKTGTTVLSYFVRSQVTDQPQEPKEV